MAVLAGAVGMAGCTVAVPGAPAADPAAARTLPDGSAAHLLGGTYQDPESGLALRNLQVMALHGSTETVVVTSTALADTWDGYGPVCSRRHCAA